ncbi:MAG: helix-turn-helix transcriptional regulator [Nanoarchaeota archaeon]
MFRKICALVLVVFFINIVFSAQISGLVYDDSDNLIAGANIHYDCLQNTSEFPNSTNSYGAFRIISNDSIDCRIYSNFKNKVGFVDVKTLSNETKKVQLKIQTEVLSTQESSSNSVLLLDILFYIIIGFILIFIIYRFSNKKKVDLSKNKEINLTSRMNDLLETLNEQEQHIVKCLISEGGRATQSKIRIETGIPKTSVHRWTLSLEKKGFVRSESFGQKKRLYLTDFFLKN